MIATEDMSEEVGEMCNLSEGVLEEGRKQERKLERQRFPRGYDVARAQRDPGSARGRRALQLSEGELLKALQ